MPRKLAALQYKGIKSNLQHRAVARALSSWQKLSGKSLREASEAAGWSTAKTSMLQNAACAISECDVAILALVYRVDDQRRADVYNGAQRARDPRAYDRLHNTEQCIGWTYGEVAAEASHLRIVATDAFPYMTRTTDYSNALQNYFADVTPLRQSSQYSSAVHELITHNLHQENSLHLHLIVSGALLRFIVGSVPVMADQLMQLMELAQLNNVTVQVVPDAVGSQAAVAGSFSIMTFREERFDDVVYLEHPHGATWLEEKGTREPYVAIFDRLAEVALSAEDSIDHIAESVIDLRTAHT